MNAAKQTIRNKISLNIPDNHVRSVTPALLRDVLEQMLDFSEETAAGGFQDITTTEDFSQWDIELGNKATITLNSDTALSIVNPLNGIICWLVVQQNGEGGYNLEFPDNSLFEDGEQITISKQPNAMTVLTILFDGVNFIWLSKSTNSTGNAAASWQQTDW